jgi:hypothetical protein
MGTGSNREKWTQAFYSVSEGLEVELGTERERAQSTGSYFKMLAVFSFRKPAQQTVKLP